MDWITILARQFARRLVQEVNAMENAQELISRMCAAPIIIQYAEGDPIIHTNDLPWCDDPFCDCHYDFTVAGEAEYQAIIGSPSRWGSHRAGSGKDL